MVTEIVIGIGTAIALGFILIKYGTAIVRKYNCQKSIAQINIMRDELSHMCKHNINNATALLEEWRINVNTDARNIWTEDELIDSVNKAKDDLAHVELVFEKFTRCNLLFSNSKQYDKRIECMEIYDEYLVNSIEFRQNLSIIPQSSDESTKAESLDADNCEYSRVLADCEIRLDALCNRRGI